jgi:ATP-dependent protease ClpP protease subunit
MKTWYTIKAQGEGENQSAEIDIFDEIGYWGIRATDFIRELNALGPVKNIHVRLNSPGGEVFDGLAIHTALKNHPAAVTVEVYGVAGSIASIIAMAGRLSMPANTFLYIHDPLAIVMGDADDMRDMADALEKIGSGLLSTYMAKSGKDEKTVKKWMANDTWFTAQEALEAGLADEVTGAVKLAALGDLSRYKNLPKALQTPVQDEAAGRIREIESLCEAAGVSDMTIEYLKLGLSVSQVRARLKDAPAIRDACTAAFRGDAKRATPRADSYIKAGMTLAEVRAELQLMRHAGAIEIDNSVPVPASPAPAQPIVDTAEIYKRRREWNKHAA